MPPMNELSDATLMMWPRRRGIMCRPAPWQMMKRELRLTLSTCRVSCRSTRFATHLLPFLLLDVHAVGPPEHPSAVHQHLHLSHGLDRAVKHVLAVL